MLETDKWMFSEEHFNFPYPLFVTSIHMLVQWLLAALVLSLFPRLRPSTRPAANDYACVKVFSQAEPTPRFPLTLILPTEQKSHLAVWRQGLTSACRT